MPSASMRAVSGLTPSERRKASTVWWRARLCAATFAAGLGQEDAAIGLAGDEALGGEAGQHLGDGRLRHAETCGDVDLPGFVAVLDQVGDQLDVIFDQRPAPGLARLAKALGVNPGLGQTVRPGKWHAGFAPSVSSLVLAHAVTAGGTRL